LIDIVEGQFAGQVTADLGTRFFFLESDRVVAGSLAFRYIDASDRGAAYHRARGNISGLAGDGQICWIRFHYDRLIGHYGCVGLYTRTGYSYWLIASDDGIHWRSPRKLSEYAR
jgi:hypothetical protein